MEVKPALALPDGLELVEYERIDDVLTITVVSTQESARCPCCHEPSTRVHSHYTRQVADLPCGGQRLHLFLHVRKFFCEMTNCVRKIFVERLAPFIEPWARVTFRLFQIVQTLGLATGGRLGVRVTERLSIQASRTTILRRIMALETSPVGYVTQIGIDDFSFRRGRKFGTIVVDLQTHQVLDVLPDRTADTSAAWMVNHPELEIISRDRGGDYAAAAKQAAPQATQCADRFHLYKNLTEATELALAHCRAEIRKQAEAKACQEVSQEVQAALARSNKAVSPRTWKPVQAPGEVQERLTRREQRLDRYQQVLTLQAQGFEQPEIARRVGLTTKTIQKWLKAKAFPEAKERRKRRSIFDPYASYVLKRWKEGERHGLRIYEEIKERGFSGTPQTVYRFLQRLRLQVPLEQAVNAPQTLVQDVVAKDAIWLFVRDPDDLDEKEQATLTAICQNSSTANALYKLVQEFHTMLHQRTGEKLDEWLEKVKASQIRELQSFVTGIERDKAAVVAGLTLPYSNGLVEGKVNKLKLIKRMMYGRAAFPLLRQRVLHAL